MTPWWQIPREELYKDAGRKPRYCSDCGDWFEGHGFFTEDDYVDVSEAQCDCVHAEVEL